VTQASLGYYVNPLVSVLLGRIVLGERLSRVQAFAVALAALGVVNLAVGLGEVPWISLALAGSFGLYGLVRKRAPVAPVPGLAVESLLLAPLAAGWLAYLLARGESVVPDASGADLALMLGSGAATGVPMLFFTAAARRLRLSTLGIVQFVSPTCQLGLAVLLYGEPFTATHAVTFACIWAAIALYAADGLLRSRRAAG
jgi:chloramphenicol-sensitive protein RarD